MQLIVEAPFGDKLNFNRLPAECTVADLRRRVSSLIRRPTTSFELECCGTKIPIESDALRLTDLHLPANSIVHARDTFGADTLSVLLSDADMDNSVAVHHLPHMDQDLTEEALRDYFKRFGTVRRVILQQDSEQQEWQRAVVTFTNNQDFARCLGTSNHVLTVNEQKQTVGGKKKGGKGRGGAEAASGGGEAAGGKITAIDISVSSIRDLHLSMKEPGTISSMIGKGMASTYQAGQSMLEMCRSTPGLGKITERVIDPVVSAVSETVSAAFGAGGEKKIPEVVISGEPEIDEKHIRSASVIQVEKMEKEQDILNRRMIKSQKSKEWTERHEGESVEGGNVEGGGEKSEKKEKRAEQQQQQQQQQASASGGGGKQKSRGQ